MSDQLIPTPSTFGENGNFLLERELGSGGMGGVYLGRDKMLDRPVAVKIMLKEYGADADFVEKFKREAQAAARLIHPNIAQIYSYGICDGMPYMAMELVAGGSLWSIMENAGSNTDIPRVLKICQQVAQALQCASDMGYVHGDVKPENILLDANGNAKLVDFGLAGMQKNADEIWGTPYYISPERVKKEQVDYRADMYSLGCTLYHALTGVPPFDGDDSIAVVKKRFEGLPQKPSAIRKELTPAIDRLVMQMLALEKGDRFPSFEALLQAFREVLTTGLTQKIPEPAKPAAAKSPAGGKRVMVRGRRMTTMRRPGASVKTTSDASDGKVPSEGSDANTTMSSEEDEDEKSDNLGLKVAIFVVGGILLLGGLGGGLYWYTASSKAAEQAAIQEQIQSGYDKAKTAISETSDKARKFADEFDAFAHKATEECEKATAELKQILPPEQICLLKMNPTKELLDAIASTNDRPQAAAAPAAAPAAPAAATNAPAVATATATNAPAKAKAAVAKAATTNAPAAKADAKAPAPADAEKAPEASQAVLTMNELWEKAYSCEASAVKIRHEIRKIVKAAVEAGQYADVTEANMTKLADISRSVVEMFEQVKISKDVENVRKNLPLIRTKAQKNIEKTAKQLRIQKLEQARKEKAEAAAAAEKERKEKIEAEKKEKIAGEIQSIKDKFDAIVAQGTIRQLDWKGAIRQLEVLKSEFETAEGQLAADVQILKVNDMKLMQDIFIKNCPNFVFKGKLRGVKVIAANDRELQILKGGNKTRLTWQKFYKDYPGNLNELINQFVVAGRKNCKPALNLRDWSAAMTGAALTMSLICSDVNGAVERSEALAKESVKQFPEYAKTAQEIFPDIKFETEEE